MNEEKKDYIGHRSRIIEKYLKTGIEAFADYEIVEFLLTYAIPRKDTKPIAKDLLKEYKTLENILNKDFDELMSTKINGLGKNSIAFLKLIGDIATRLYRDKLDFSDITKISNKETLINFIRANIGYEKVEKFFVLYLSNSNTLLECQEEFSGTLDQSAIYPREIYKNILKYNAKAIIIAHNHPSGSLRPSRSDINITEEIAKGLKSFGAVLLEHIIITDNSYFSFLEEGLI